MDENKGKTIFYRNRNFWIIIIIVLALLWALSTMISGRRAKMNNQLNSMPKVEYVTAHVQTQQTMINQAGPR